QRNKEIVHKVEQLWIDGKLDQLDEYFGTVDHSPDRRPMVPQGLAGAKMAHQGAMQAFQGRTLEIKDIFAGDDKVFVRSTFSAQYVGGVPGIDAPASGRPVKDIESWSVYRLTDAKIVDHRDINDGVDTTMH